MSLRPFYGVCSRVEGTARPQRSRIKHLSRKRRRYRNVREWNVKTIVPTNSIGKKLAGARRLRSIHLNLKRHVRKPHLTCCLLVNFPCCRTFSPFKKDSEHFSFLR